MTPPVLRYQKQIVELAIKHRLPSIWERSEFVEAGGLVSYAASDDDVWRRAAYYADKILKGTKPADLPVEQPTKFEFVINLKTAQADRTNYSAKCVLAESGSGDSVAGGSGQTSEIRENITWQIAYAETDI